MRGLLLAERTALAPATWVAADGVLVMRAGTLALAARSLRAIPPPADPFLYR